MPRALFRAERARTLVALLAAVGLVAGAAACKEGGDNPAASTSASAAGAGTAPPGDVLAESRAVATTVYKGTFRSPDPTTRIAAKHKKVAIISPGQLAPSAKVPVDAAADAVRTLGWEVTILDLKLNPSNTPDAVKQAIAAGVDGIVAGVDCAYAPNEFAEAKAKGILIVPMFTFDCTDPTVAGRPGQSAFTTQLNYTIGAETLDAARYVASGGYLAAAALIAATNGTAKIIEVTDVTSTVLTYTHAAFMNQIKRCTGCQVLEEIPYSYPDVADGSLRAKIRDALARHPDVTAIRGALSSTIQLAIAPEVVAAKLQNQVLVLGGEGQEPDLDLIRTKQGLNVTVATDVVWAGWAVIDALNSGFNGEKARPSGLGSMLVDKDHNLPPSGTVQHNVNFKGVYRKAWGVGG